MRIIALIDMDCFYCQVEEKLNPDLQGKPVAVVQYNLWREGGIIAANYLAKEKGVTKGMWMHEAKSLCPEIEFARVAELRGRADLTKYRDAGKQVADVLSSFTNIVERASVDEAYLDLTETVKAEFIKGISNISVEKLSTTHVVGCSISDFISNITSNQDTDGFSEDDLKLAVGGIIVEKIREEVYQKTGYRCSAGISHNKILAKLVCGLHKPNKQTILPRNAIQSYFSELPLKKIKRLGGKFGKKISEELNIQFVGDLMRFSERELVKMFDSKNGVWLYNLARGIDNEPVTPKLLCKSISCCKRFPGKNALFKEKDIEHWMKELGIEIEERLKKDQEENNRQAKTMTVSFTQEINKADVSNTKTCKLKTYDSKGIAADALQLVKKFCCKSYGSYHIKYLGISVGNFENLKNKKDLRYFLDRSCSSSTSNEFKHIDNLEDKSEINESMDVTFNKNSAVIKHKEIDTNIQIHNFQEIFKNDDMTENRSRCVDSSPLNHRSEVEKQEKNSFFAMYFRKVETSIESKVSNNNPCHESSKPKDFINREMIENKVSDCGENQQKIELDAYQECEECGKDIEVTNIQSHFDYHFALKLAKQESSLNGTKRNESKISTSKQTKRKFREVGSKSIESFFKVSDLDDTENTKICKECNKGIALKDWESHNDYHVAKKLNRELNFVNNSHDSLLNRRKQITNLNGISSYLTRKSS